MALPVAGATPHRSAQKMSATFQFFAALIVGVCYYMLAMAMTVYDGILSLIFHPIIAVILTSIAIGVVGVVGIPIRLGRRLRLWWIDHWWISLVIGTIAFAMMWASWLPDLRTQVWNPDLETHEDSFHPTLGFGGWLLTIFAVFHFFPPIKSLRRTGKQTQAEQDGGGQAATRSVRHDPLDFNT